MGRIVKKLSDSTTKYYWYPGQKDEWIRALMAVATGAGVATLLMIATGSSLTSVVTGSAATLAVAGFNFGRRDAKALMGFPNRNDKATGRAAMVYTGRAVWRGMVQGFGTAFAAVLVLNMKHSTWTADWILPLVPAVVGALGHQAGMVWDRMATMPTPRLAAAKAVAESDGG